MIREAPTLGVLSLAARPNGGVSHVWACRVDFCSLANNHILDFQEEGMLETMRSLAAAGIKFAGCGANLEEASEPAHLSVRRPRTAQSLTSHLAGSAVEATFPLSYDYELRLLLCLHQPLRLHTAVSYPCDIGAMGDDTSSHGPPRHRGFQQQPSCRTTPFIMNAVPGSLIAHLWCASAPLTTSATGQRLQARQAYTSSTLQGALGKCKRQESLLTWKVEDWQVSFRLSLCVSVGAPAGARVWFSSPSDEICGGKGVLA